jgi:hypothetical protein
VCKGRYNATILLRVLKLCLAALLRLLFFLPFRAIVSPPKVNRGQKDVPYGLWVNVREMKRVTDENQRVPYSMLSLGPQSAPVRLSGAVENTALHESDNQTT